MTNKFNPSSRRYNKRNFKEALELITPQVYKLEDIALSGEGVDEVDNIINKHCLLANEFSGVISLSSVADTAAENLDSFSGISKFFVKQNGMTRVTPFSLERDILLPLGTSLAKYDTSAEFLDYVSGTLLPQIIPPSITDDSVLQSNIGTLSALTQDANASSVHVYLTEKLGLFYFLNTSADGGLDWSPSSYVANSLASLYRGNRLDTVDGIKGITNHLWRNVETCSTFNRYLPNNFVSGAADAIVDSNLGNVATYTSGTQKLESLETLIDVIYSPLKIDEQDYRVKDALEDYKNLGILIDDQKPQGPFTKFNEGMGFLMGDLTDQIEQLGLIYDINEAPDEYLQYLADLIGWRLKGAFPDKWRHQLRNAVEIYKKKGTLQAIQLAVDSFVTDTILDASGSASELWESYVPFLIWYSLATESPFFTSLKTWTKEKSSLAGLFVYDSLSLESNLKMVTDFILLKLYKKYPEYFRYNGEEFPVNRLFKLDLSGEQGDLYTVPFEPAYKDFFVLKPTDPGYASKKKEAYSKGQKKAWDESYGMGVLGEGNYFEGLDFVVGEDFKYLKPTGDPSFVFNYRKHKNFPMPPFEEVKFYQDAAIGGKLIDSLVAELKCFGVDPDFADSVGTFLVDSTITSDINIEDEYLSDSLHALNNSFLFFFKSPRQAPNYDAVLSGISEYEKNPLPLWNGKSSHLFIDFDEFDFEYGQTTIEGEGKYALINTAIVAREFAPGHAIVKTNFNLNAESNVCYSGTMFQYANIDKTEDGFQNYTSGAVLAGFETSGVSMAALGQAADGMPTFKRDQANSQLDPAFFSSTGYDLPNASVPRRSLRRRNLKNVLPLEGYYDRTGFNQPTAWDPSAIEGTDAIILGYDVSSGDFHPVIDPGNLSGVWTICEDLNSPRTFFGVDTSNTFPFRGINGIGSDAKNDHIPSATDRYVDRGQTPGIYITMHDLFEDKALKNAEELIETANTYVDDINWKNIKQSLANEAIASGFVLNSFDDYVNFSFGRGMQDLYQNYTDQFQKHSLKEQEKSGASVVAHVFNRGLYNNDMSIDGSAVTTKEGTYVNTALADAVSISQNNGSGVFSVCAVENGHASGTYIASSTGDVVVPVQKTFVQGDAFHAEFRNPHILSGIEFTDVSGAPSSNEFFIFDLSSSNDFLQNNRVIKAKTYGGFPRLRFDLSSYGTRRNYFVNDHEFEFRLNAVVGDETSNEIGGGSIGVWIHTQPVAGYIWSYAPNGEWVMTKESEIGMFKVKNELAHIHTFDVEVPPVVDQEKCLTKLINQPEGTFNTSLGFINGDYVKTISFPFNTYNYTTFNNYKTGISVPEEYYKHKQQVHDKDTNYVVEVFFNKPALESKYLLIDSFELQDLTLRDWAGIPTGYGIETSSRPNLPFVQEDKLEFTEPQLIEVLNFYNGLINQGKVKYNTILASRVASDTSAVLEVSGGGRLNYRTYPYWHEHEKHELPETLQASSITFIN